MSDPQDSAAPEAREGGSAVTSNADSRASADSQAGADETATTTHAGAEGEAAATAAPPGDKGSGSADEPGVPSPSRRRKRRKRSFWRELPILIAVALLLAVVIKTYAIQAFYIPSGSMENTLLVNDRVLVNKLVYDVRSIHRGDIVVFNGDGSWDPGTPPRDTNFIVKFGQGFASMFGFGHPGDILIKRVIGLPGDKVACCDAQGRVTVNGVPLSEQSYLYPGDAPSEIRFNIVVPPGRLWVMGDHRLISDDSRNHMGDPGGGTIPENAVIGRAFVIIWPPSRWAILPIPATFQQPQLNAAAPASAQDTAGLQSARLEPSSPALPLAFGFAAALPLTWLQRRARLRLTRRRATRRRATRRRATRHPAARHPATRHPATRHPATRHPATRRTPRTPRTPTDRPPSA